MFIVDYLPVYLQPVEKRSHCPQNSYQVILINGGDTGSYVMINYHTLEWDEGSVVSITSQKKSLTVLNLEVVTFLSIVTCKWCCSLGYQRVQWEHWILSTCISIIEIITACDLAKPYYQQKALQIYRYNIYYE